MTKKKILMAVGNEFAFDGRVQRAVEALKDDFEITVLAFKSPVRIETDSFSLIEVNMPNFKSYKGLKRILVPLLHLYFWLMIILYTIKIRPHIFYGHDFFMAFPCFLISLLSNISVIYDAHELIIATDKYSHNFELKIWYFLEKLVVKRANLIIAANEERARIMKEHYSLKNPPIFFRNLTPSKEKELSDNLFNISITKNSGEVFVIYQGVMDLDRGLINFIDAFRFLPDKFRLILIGYGKDYEEIKKHIKLANLENKVYAFEKIPRKSLPDLIKKCDIGIVAYSNQSLNEEYCEPNKLYDYVQLGLPVICTCQINLIKIMEKYKIGVVICDSDKVNISQRIADEVIKVSDNLEYYKNNIDEFLKKEYNWENEKERLLQAIKKF